MESRSDNLDLLQDDGQSVVSVSVASEINQITTDNLNTIKGKPKLDINNLFSTLVKQNTMPVIIEAENQGAGEESPSPRRTNLPVAESKERISNYYDMPVGEQTEDQKNKVSE